MVSAFEAVTGDKIQYSIVDRRDGDVDTCFASTDKAKDELGFQATRTLADMC